eukprot:COSAG01_NODE_1202_length_11263_cov_64.078466_12_plen_83_part_00
MYGVQLGAEMSARVHAAPCIADQVRRPSMSYLCICTDFCQLCMLQQLPAVRQLVLERSWEGCVDLLPELRDELEEDLTEDQL